MLTKICNFVKIFFAFSIPLFATSLEEKIGHLVIVPVCPDLGRDHLEKVDKLLRKNGIQNIIFTNGRFSEQQAFLQILNKGRERPLMTFQDAEWGVGMRLSDVPALPKQGELGASNDLEATRKVGREIGRECRWAGIRANFAPVVDVVRCENPVVGDRSFGSDPKLVSVHAKAIMRGMQEEGIITCAKHFPGHGWTSIDSHFALPTILQPELYPFQFLIDAGVEMVMVGHLLCPSLSSYPASMSYEIMTELLREEMGFEGLIVTDALNMRALVSHYSLEEILERSLLGGADMLLFADSDPQIIELILDWAIPSAIEHIKKTIPPELIDAKFDRVTKSLHCCMEKEGGIDERESRAGKDQIRCHLEGATELSGL